MSLLNDKVAFDVVLGLVLKQVQNVPGKPSVGTAVPTVMHRGDQA